MKWAEGAQGDGLEFQENGWSEQWPEWVGRRFEAIRQLRGQRRYQQNGPDTAKAESVLRELRERDRRDRTRAESPLVPAPDAVIIDSTPLTLDEVVAKVEAIVRERLAGQSNT